MIRPMRMLLVDVQPLYLAGIEQLFRAEWGDCKLDAFSNAAEALERLRCEHFDLALVNWETLNADELNQMLELAASKCIVLTTANDDAVLVQRALAAGVRAIVAKRAAARILAGAVAWVLDGGFCYPSRALPVLSQGPLQSSERVGVSPRELEILHHLERGDSNKAIARELKLSVATVKFHVQNILRGTRARNRVEAVLNARALGLLAPVRKLGA